MEKLFVAALMLAACGGDVMSNATSTTSTSTMDADAGCVILPLPGSCSPGTQRACKSPPGDGCTDTGIDAGGEEIWCCK